MTPLPPFRQAVAEAIIAARELDGLARGDSHYRYHGSWLHENFGPCTLFNAAGALGAKALGWSHDLSISVPRHPIRQNVYTLMALPALETGGARNLWDAAFYLALGCEGRLLPPAESYFPIPARRNDEAAWVDFPCQAADFLSTHFEASR